MKYYFIYVVDDVKYDKKLYDLLSEYGLFDGSGWNYFVLFDNDILKDKVK